MKEVSKGTKWYIVYDILAKALFDFYNNCIESKLDPSKELYKILINDADYKSHNNWIDKFDMRFGYESVDPIHFFASFNNSGSSSESRKEKIFILLSILKVNHKIEKIDFKGCPAPMILKMISVRKPEAQLQIWDLFQRIHKQKIEGIKKLDFEIYKNWYGIELSALTIFLFWIQSDCFIPLDVNTKTFLLASKLVVSIPKDYLSYKTLIKKIDLYNYNENEKYGPRGIFREITQLSFNIIQKRIETNQYSRQYWEFYINTSKKTKIELGEKESIVENKEKQDELLKTITTTTKLGFRLIAVRPLANCSDKYLNILKIDQIYYFEKAFIIENDKITFKPEKTISIYDQLLDSNDSLKFNITAIVGKNGSGKSSLVELIYRIINNIAFAQKNKLKTKNLSFIEDLSAEIYYIESGDIYCITIDNRDVTIQNYLYNGSYFVKQDNLRSFETKDFEKFFYTIAVNYSHYSLNSRFIGNWIENIFQKNDSYQTPLVINPMRGAGIIDINSENDLIKYRLIANLFSPILNKENLGIRKITEKQQAIEVHFKRNKKKENYLFYRWNKRKQLEAIDFNRLKTSKSIIIRLVNEIFNIPKSTNLSKLIVKETYKYIIRKLVRISANYFQYSVFFDKINIEFNMLKMIEYLKLLKEDASHITYKLKQAIYYLKYPDLIVKEEEFIIDIEEYSKKLGKFLSDNKDQVFEIIELLPPPIFEPTIILIDENNKMSEFEKLSSGEKQLIHSVSSILYHLKNIDSVNSEKFKIIGYRNIYILLDEIELYYHPEMQRRYVNYLLDMISKLYLSRINSINICLVTHSPYILSDIPDFYTLRLDKGIPQLEEFKTFGANIHDLLANDFFMENGVMGEYAKGLINKLFSFLIENKAEDESNEYFTETKAKSIINMVGEPVIKYELIKLFDIKFKKSTELEFINNEIERLQELKERKQNDTDFSS